MQRHYFFHRSDYLHQLCSSLPSSYPGENYRSTIVYIVSCVWHPIWLLDIGIIISHSCVMDLQNLDVNLGSRSPVILSGIPCSGKMLHITDYKESSAVSLVLPGRNRTRLDNRSTHVFMASYPCFLIGRPTTKAVARHPRRRIDTLRDT